MSDGKDPRATLQRQIVVAFRMPPAGLAPGPEGSYLVRARSMCARGEALGGRLIAWSGALLAMAWETDAIEEALDLATSLREESSAPERAWTCGVAEGELEALALDGQRMHLAWGEALRSAASLARIAKAGEVLVDGDVRALRSGQLALVGARSATDAGQRVRGWRLDLDRPWKQGPPGFESSRDASASAASQPSPAVEASQPPAPAESSHALYGIETSPASPRYQVTQVPPDFEASTGDAPGIASDATDPGFDVGDERDEVIVVTASDLEVAHLDRDPTQPTPVVEFEADEEFDDEEELSSADVLQVIEASALQPFVEEPPTSARRRGGTLADRVRALSQHDKNRDPVVAIADLRRARARAEDAAPAVRCQAALALAMALSMAGRVEDALLEALDALSSARVTGDPRAINACVALLSKLYTGAGFPDAARTLKETAEGARTSHT